MHLPLDDEDLRWLFEKWQSETAETAAKKRQLDQLMERLKEAKEPFFRKQQEYLDKKRRKDKNAFLTADERDEIWKPFRDVFRQIVSEVISNTPAKNIPERKE